MSPSCAAHAWWRGVSGLLDDLSGFAQVKMRYLSDASVERLLAALEAILATTASSSTGSSGSLGGHAPGGTSDAYAVRRRVGLEGLP
jgi:hypothetical protein